MTPMSRRISEWLNRGIFVSGIGSFVAGACFICFGIGDRALPYVAFGAGMACMGVGLLVNAWWVARARAYDTLEALDRLTDVYERIESEDAEGERDPLFEPRTKADAKVLISLSDFLPDPLPAGWSKPIAPRGRVEWIMKAGQEEVLLGERVRGAMTLRLRVAIVPPKGSAVAVSDERCREILSCLPGIEAWAEIDGPGPQSSTRFWFGAPHGMRPRVSEYWWSKRRGREQAPN